MIELQIEELQVRAPADGVVETLAVRPGDLVSPGRRVAVLFDPARVYVLAYAAAGDAAALRAGMPAKVRVANTTVDTDVVIQHVSSTPEYSPRLEIGENRIGPFYPIKLSAIRPLEGRPGALVTVSIPVGASAR
jgi:multidrug efflux pump subunit AcrA (membrane-fusion protein)